MKKICLFFSIALLLTACKKEEEPQFTNVRRILPIDGSYKGELHLRCDSIGMNSRTDVTIRIVSLNQEEVFITNQLCVGQAFLESSGNAYHYGQLQWIDVTDCGRLVSMDFKGTGTLQDDSLKEAGIFILYSGSKKYTGKWSTKAVRLDSQ